MTGEKGKTAALAEASLVPAAVFSTALTGVVFFDEHLGPSKLVGGAAILVGVYLARRR